MANLQQTLEALQPYVIGIRYLERVPVIDVVFKDGWILPESNTITKIKGNQELNYHMIYSDNESIGLDELLEYVDLTIKANIEREKKHELLKEKIAELKDVFKKTTLTKLKRLKFSFNEDEDLPEINDFDLDEIEQPQLPEPTLVTQPSDVVENQIDETKLTEEELEILEEEKRAQAYREIQAAKKLNGQVKNISSKVELPPKKKILQTIGEDDYNGECECGPEEACGKCIDRKGF